MATQKSTWQLLSGDFPPTVATNKPATELKPNETANATGISISNEGFMVKGTIPSGTTRIVKTYTIAATAYEWHYNRVWRLSGSDLIYGAPDYTATYFKQGPGEINFKEDAQNLLKMIPIGETGLALFKSTGAYVLPDASSQGGNFGKPDFIQEAKISTATHVVELDGTVYFCNTDGLFSLSSSGKVEEISLPIRGQVTPAALTADYKAKYIIVGAVWAYDVVFKRWLKYSGSTFVYTSRAIRASEDTPISVQAVRFEFERTNTSQSNIKFKTRTEVRKWGLVDSVNIPYERGTHVSVERHLQVVDTGNWFQLQVTSMGSNLKLKRIYALVSGYTEESRDS